MCLSPLILNYASYCLANDSLSDPSVQILLFEIGRVLNVNGTKSLRAPSKGTEMFRNRHLLSSL